MALTTLVPGQHALLDTLKRQEEQIDLEKESEVFFTESLFPFLLFTPFKIVQHFVPYFIPLQEWREHRTDFK